jgi:glycosyltransferase involved in cell wall biosynthesis
VQIEGRSDVIYDYGISNNIDPDYVQYVAGNTKFIEYAFMKQYDAIFALSEADKINIQQNVTSKTKVYTSPFGILDADINDLDVDSLKFENLIFMGGEGHHPNADALSWFLTDIINKFTIRPFNKLYVTGEWSEKTINKYKQLYDCVDFVGFVDDLTPYLKNSISIVPIRIGGGGIRTKILSAMAQGSPVVATSLSAMGIKYEDKKNLLIANTAGDFVNAINNLFNDGEFARNISREAHGLIVKDYTQSRVGEIRNKIYEEIFYGQ